MISSPMRWQFQSRFRKNAFGQRGSNAAIERITQAVSEIKNAARSATIAGGEGAIAFISRISLALEHVDSSSGALGSTVNWAIDELVPVIADAPADPAVRRAWLEKLWKAFTADQIPYIERLGERWGELCAIEPIAAEWADRLLPDLIESFRPDTSRSVSYFQGSMACFSAMMAAKQYQRIIEVIERADKNWWQYRKWGFRALVAQGERVEALRYAEASRDSTRTFEAAIAGACEMLLLESGMREEAYNRYAIAACGYEPTYLARFRSLAKKYPWKNAADMLRDLVATTPGKEGKWFAAAKSAGLFDEAAMLAQATPCDPKTLSRAARDFKTKRPAFAIESSLAALRWFAEGYGYEVTNVDVIDAYRSGLAAAEGLKQTEEFKSRAEAIVANGSAFVRDTLRSVGADATRPL